MATQLRRHGDAQLEAQRWQASQAARPLIQTRDQAQVMAKDLVNALDAGDTTEARRIALALRPFLGLLEDESTV